MDTAATSPIPFREALKFWFRLGCISFGGPAGQIAIMHRELVEQKRWISEKRFLHALNFCMVLPGPEAQQLATYLGWLMHRTWGGVVAGALFVLPSLVLLIALSWAYVMFGSVPWVSGIFYGIKPAVAALVLQAVHRIGNRTLKKPAAAPVLWTVAASSFIANAVLDVPFPVVVLLAAVIGWWGQRVWPSQFATSAKHGAANAEAPHAAAWIDDDAPTPTHAQFSRARLLHLLAVGALLWLLPMGVLVLWQGWDSTLAQMGWFFTKAALLTFGGAYAVLPYVFQGAVEHFAWLNPAQMMDGLALGETTPGPLIMVVTFVGFVGGWTQQVLGADAMVWGAALAALVVTWFTFLPSFIFVLAGGPWVESTHGNVQFTAPLTAITAAVVGVIASLALFFLVQIAWHPATAGGAARLDGVSITLALAATAALIRFQRGVVPVILACGATGFALRLLGWI